MMARRHDLLAGELRHAEASVNSKIPLPNGPGLTSSAVASRSGLATRPAISAHVTSPGAAWLLSDLNLSLSSTRATRYDKLAVRYEATLHITAINEWL